MCALPKNIAATKKWPCGQPNNHSAAALHLVPPLQYDVVKDFEPVLLLADAPLLLVASKAVPANDLREFIAWLKLNPDKSSMGTVGAGSPGHLLGLLLQKETGTRFGLVAYRGAGPAMQDVVAGQIETTFANTATSLPHVRAGSAKAFAVTAKKRLAVAPDIPSVDEAGLPVLHFSLWAGLFAPRGTPKDIISKLNTAAVSTLGDPTIRESLAEQGFEIPQRERETPRRLVPIRRPRSRNGGRSSRRRTSRRNKASPTLQRGRP